MTPSPNIDISSPVHTATTARGACCKCGEVLCSDQMFDRVFVEILSDRKLVLDGVKFCSVIDLCVVHKLHCGLRRVEQLTNYWPGVACRCGMAFR